MSLQNDCRKSMEELALQGAVFTEIDVANQASKGKGWLEKNFKTAAKKAHETLYGAYKSGKLVRYGPVNYQGNEDYARKGTKIVYADAQSGPRIWTTPNGGFPRLAYENDLMSRAGRRVGTTRDDTKRWDIQTVQTRVVEKPVAVAPLPSPKGPMFSDEELKALVNELAPLIEEKVRDRLAEILISE